MQIVLPSLLAYDQHLSSLEVAWKTENIIATKHCLQKWPQSYIKNEHKRYDTQANNI